MVGTLVGVTERPSTRERILTAATAEFAQHGFAGARVDRIAATAEANKERLYAYFGDKKDLFQAVMSTVVSDADSWLPRSAQDLPGTTGDLFETAFSSPDLLRLLAWRRLESPVTSDDREHTEIARKRDDIREAQAQGLIDPSWDPTDVLAIVAALAGAWANAADPLQHLAEADGPPVRNRRAVVEEALRRMLSPQPT